MALARALPSAARQLAVSAEAVAIGGTDAVWRCGGRSSGGCAVAGRTRRRGTAKLVPCRAGVKAQGPQRTKLHAHAGRRSAIAASSTEAAGEHGTAHAREGLQHTLLAHRADP